MYLYIKEVFSFTLFSFESGILENPKTHRPPGLFQMTSDLEKAPDQSEKLEIEFKKGEQLKKWYSSICECTTQNMCEELVRTCLVLLIKCC